MLRRILRLKNDPFEEKFCIIVMDGGIGIGIPAEINNINFLSLKRLLEVESGLNTGSVLQLMFSNNVYEKNPGN